MFLSTGSVLTATPRRAIVSDGRDGAIARITRGIADAFSAVGPDEVDCIESVAAEIVDEAERGMPLGMPGMSNIESVLPAIGPESNEGQKAYSRDVLAIAQVLSRELQATSDEQLAWVAERAAEVWDVIICEMGHPFAS